jgi:hypothetical protein
VQQERSKDAMIHSFYCIYNLLANISAVLAFGLSILVMSFVSRNFLFLYVPLFMVCSLIRFWQGASKTLVMREINEESVSEFLENKEALAPCNVAAFVYDRCLLHCLYFMLPDVGITPRSKSHGHNVFSCL